MISGGGTHVTHVDAFIAGGESTFALVSALGISEAGDRRIIDAGGRASEIERAEFERLASDMIELATPLRLMDGQSVLCVGSDFTARLRIAIPLLASSDASKLQKILNGQVEYGLRLTSEHSEVAEALRSTVEHAALRAFDRLASEHSDPAALLAYWPLLEVSKHLRPRDSYIRGIWLHEQLGVNGSHTAAALEMEALLLEEFDSPSDLSETIAHYAATFGSVGEESHDKLVMLSDERLGLNSEKPMHVLLDRSNGMGHVVIRDARSRLVSEISKTYEVNVTYRDLPPRSLSAYRWLLSETYLYSKINYKIGGIVNVELNGIEDKFGSGSIS